MTFGATRTQTRRWLLLGLGLCACGGRTIDDGVYEAQGSGQVLTCSYRGMTYADGSLIGGACVCFCSGGQIECEAGCTNASGGSTASGGASSGGSTARGGASTGGGTGSGGASSGGSTGSGGASSGGAAGSSVGGSASAGTGGTAGAAGSVSGGSTGVGAAGGTSTGGSAGATNLSCGSPPRATGYPTLIDDMEDGTSFISRYDGRSGGWFTYNDGTPGVQIPNTTGFQMQSVSSDASGGTVVANTHGKGFTSWGAGMGFVLNSGCPYDASVYKGMHFFVRAETAPASGSIYFLVPTAATTPTGEGGTCVQRNVSGCYDDYQMRIAVTSGWTEEYVPFDLLVQQGWGNPVSFDAGTLIGVNFQTLSGEGNSFSFSIDSISFY
jgi:hypothetical protein